MVTDRANLRRVAYLNGLSHGRALYAYMALTDHEPALRLELALGGQRNRAYALGALRGYRQASDLPNPQQ